MKSEIIKGIEFNQVKDDYYGNPRFVVHFLNFLKEEEIEMYETSQGYEFALSRAKRAGFRIFRGKDFDGGFVVQSYSLTDTAKRIIQVRSE